MIRTVSLGPKVSGIDRFDCTSIGVSAIIKFIMPLAYEYYYSILMIFIVKHLR